MIALFNRFFLVFFLLSSHSDSVTRTGLSQPHTIPLSSTVFVSLGRPYDSLPTLRFCHSIYAFPLSPPTVPFLLSPPTVHPKALRALACYRSYRIHSSTSRLALAHSTSTPQRTMPSNFRIRTSTHTPSLRCKPSHLVRTQLPILPHSPLSLYLYSTIRIFL